jgi:hypothetical protein
MKQKLKITFGIILLPIFFTLYMADKFVLWFMPWKTTDTVQIWIYDPKKATYSLFRVLFVLSIYGLYKLIF